VLNLILQDKEKTERQTILFQFCVISEWIILIWLSLCFFFQTLTRGSSVTTPITDAQFDEQILGE
jgi:hypothetical protein